MPTTTPKTARPTNGAPAASPAPRTRTTTATTTINATPEIRRVKLADLKPAPYNPRRISPVALAGLEKSIEHFGNVEPIIWNETSGFIVGGHQRFKVLRSKRVKTADVVVVHLDPQQERTLNVALNNPNITGEFTGTLEALLQAILANDAVAFHELRLAELLGTTVAPTPLDPDQAPPLPTTAQTQPGDVYQLGRHKLICGDCTNVDVVHTLFGKQRVDALVTDPPYGVDYVGKTEFLRKRGIKSAARHRDIANDLGRDYQAFFADFLRIIPWNHNYATLYIFMSSLELHHLRLAIDDVGLTWGDYLIWVKNAPVIGRKDYNQKSELVVLAFPEDNAPKQRADFVVYGWPQRHRFFGGTASNNVLEYPKPSGSKLHPTMKPVAMLKQLITDGSPDGAIVYDPFAGSGSTLIACEELGRSCRAIELDPLYCDVIVQRWQDFTQQHATKLNHAAATATTR